jgi:peptidoglycan/xylan/chitin deacetylase (PgdA/CDA1 family)
MMPRHRSSVLVVAAVLFLTGALMPSVGAVGDRTCQGHRVTILGTAGNDRLFGTPGADVIDGGPGDDFIAGGDGADIICGGAGNDEIYGERGKDVIAGGRGEDIILGNRGRDRLAGGRGADVIGGGVGADTLRGGKGDDAVRGGRGADMLRGGPGLDECDGGVGIDRAVGCETPRGTEKGNRPPVVLHPGGRFVALTFDDGPDPRWTPQVLDVLAEYGVHATFFVIGLKAAEYPGLIRRMIREGHSVQNHTHSHAWLTRYSNAAAEEEIATGAADIVAAAGVTPRCLRPPYGAISDRITALARAEGESIVMWNVDPQDWRNPSPSYVAGHVLRYTRGGDVVLLHDGAGPTAGDSLPAIIEGLLDRGLRFTTICN